jgi:hypothetical protein
MRVVMASNNKEIIIKMKQDGHYNVDQQITYCCPELENIVKNNGVIGLVNDIGLCLKTLEKPYLIRMEFCPLCGATVKHIDVNGGRVK